MWLCIAACVNAQAATTCLQDLNGDGFTDAPGETASCVTTAQGELCPISASACTVTETCPLDPSTACVSGSCKVMQSVTTAGTCVDTTKPLNLPTFTCVETGVAYNWPQQPFLAQSVCQTNCVATSQVPQVAVCTISNPTCPLGGGYACMDNAGHFECSANTCTDLTLTPPVATPTDTSMLVNDGARAADGSCVAKVNIFGGRPMECKVEGTRSAFRNCCAEGDEVMQDSMSGAGNIGLAYDVVKAVYYAVQGANAAYDAMIAGGQTVATAVEAQSLAFTNYLAAAGPGIAVAVAVALIVNWVANACNATDMETSMLDNSKMCHSLGKKCIEKWAGSCVQRSEVFCCFNSKIGRIVHEQGRSQLKSFINTPGSVFGSVDTPQCRGFEPNEFQALDFSKIDLSEYFDDVKNAAAGQIKVTNTIQTDVDLKINGLP